ncbi:MAG: phosphate ABC transporter substrate-binding protein [Methylothermaceae bacteria B42]|nr:MAG: phosphate ABC transporter substrate-binding protein [Methylothermaceae bacteria B42]HHJ38960.1 phosphate/phosphite/phosphonate ABC transporter substrate-binding protein [Methylothermaceae bacterium]
MTYMFTVSPDFSPDHLSGWFIFNTWLQRVLETRFHLELFDDFQALHRAIADDKVDLIYSNPYDAATLVREKGFTSLVKPRGGSDEALIASLSDSQFSQVEDLSPGAKIATTDDPDVHLMGMMLLEPAGLSKNNIQLIECGNYVQVAKKLLQGECDAGIFFADAFDELSRPIQRQLKVLVRSDIQVLHHSLMASPTLIDLWETLLGALLAMEITPKTQEILKSLGISGWDPVDREETEFMIDLMDTLTYSPAES